MNEKDFGKKVIAKDYSGSPLIRYLIDIGDNVFYLCSEDQFYNLRAGKKDVPAIGFPKCDVYQYYDGIDEVITNHKLRWDQLQPMI